MAAIDKLYDKNGKVVMRLDAYDNEELKDFKKQIDMYLEDYDDEELYEDEKTEKLKKQLLEQLEERGLDIKHIPIICEYLDAIELRTQKELLEDVWSRGFMNDTGYKIMKEEINK